MEKENLYESEATPVNPADKLIVRTDRPLTFEEQRHNQRIVNATRYASQPKQAKIPLPPAPPAELPTQAPIDLPIPIIPTEETI